MDTKSIELRTNNIWIEDDGIVRVVVNDKARQTFADANETIRAIGGILKKNNFEKTPCYVDLSNNASIEKGARDHYSGKESAEVLSALALIINSPVSKVIGNFFFGINKTEFSTQLFTGGDDAMAWLKGYLE